MWPVGDYAGRITPTASEASPAANTSYYTYGKPGLMKPLSEKGNNEI